MDRKQPHLNGKKTAKETFSEPCAGHSFLGDKPCSRGILHRAETAISPSCLAKSKAKSPQPKPELITGDVVLRASNSFQE
jgi:hypothetical protein